MGIPSLSNHFCCITCSISDLGRAIDDKLELGCAGTCWRASAILVVHAVSICRYSCTWDCQSLFTLSIFPRLSSIQRLFFASSILAFFSGDTVVAEGAAAAEEELTKSALDMEGTWEDDELARRGMGARPSATSMHSAS